MTRARDFADVISGQHDLPSGALDNATLVNDTSPQLGGNLDLNSNNITGTGNIPAGNLTGSLPALDGSSLTGVDPFPSGTSMLFQQTAAPTGWTKQTTHNDKALRIVTGTVGTGGSAAFSTALATPSVSGSVSISGAPSKGNLGGNATINGNPNVSGNINSHTLSVNQIPSHSHGGVFNVGSNNNNAGGIGAGNGSAKNTNNTGGNGGHNHGHNFSGSKGNLGGNSTINGAPGIGNLGGSLSSATSTINVSYVDFIIANKD